MGRTSGENLHAGHRTRLRRRKAEKGQARELVLPTDDDPPGDAVPAWAMAAFWAAFGSRLRPTAEVSVVPEAVNPRDLRTAMGEPLAAPTGMTSCYVFFVDQYPEANWAHECAYVFIASNGGRGWLDAEWPPEEHVELSECSFRSGRLAGSPTRDPIDQ